MWRSRARRRSPFLLNPVKPDRNTYLRTTAASCFGMSRNVTATHFVSLALLFKVNSAGTQTTVFVAGTSRSELGLGLAHWRG